MFNFIKIDGKFKEYFNGFTGKMESNSSNPNPNPNKIQTRNALTAFLYSCASLTSVRRSDLFNPKVPSNIAFWGLFGESGPLNTKDKRDAFFEIMMTDGNGTSVRDGNVIFSPEFSSRIDSIVSQFLEGIDDSQSSSDVANSAGQPNATVATAGGSAVCQRKPSGKPNATVATAGGGAACQKKTSGQPKEAVAIAGGGGAVCEKSKQKPKTFAELIAESKTKQPQQKLMTCLLCMHTNPDGSGKCISRKQCHGFHPFNLATIIPKKVLGKDGKERLIAPVCDGFTKGLCHNEGCKTAHLTIEEYDKVFIKNEAYAKSKEEESSKASRPEKLKKPPQSLVPSQVLFGRPSSSSALPVSHLLEMPGYSFDPRDQFLGFLDLGLFPQWSSVVSEKKPDDVDFSHQPSAVEVFDSSDDEENVEGDE